MKDIFKTAREIILDEGAWEHSVSGQFGVLDRQAMLKYLSELAEMLNKSITESKGADIYPDLDGFLQFKIAMPKDYTMAELELLCDDEDIQCMEEYKMMRNRLEQKLRGKILQAMFKGEIKDKAGNVALQNIFGFADKTSASLTAQAVGVPAPSGGSKAKGELVDFSSIKKIEGSASSNRLDSMKSISASFVEVEDSEE